MNHSLSLSFILGRIFVHLTIDCSLETIKTIKSFAAKRLNQIQASIEISVFNRNIVLHSINLKQTELCYAIVRTGLTAQHWHLWHHWQRPTQTRHQTNSATDPSIGVWPPLSVLLSQIIFLSVFDINYIFLRKLVLIFIETHCSSDRNTGCNRFSLIYNHILQYK